MYKSVNVLVKVPRPVLSVVWLSLIVGFCEVLQHTPRAVTAVKPSLVTSPPQVADVYDMSLIVLVLTVGVGTKVLKYRCVPYAVPALLVAYART